MGLAAGNSASMWAKVPAYLQGNVLFLPWGCAADAYLPCIAKKSKQQQTDQGSQPRRHAGEDCLCCVQGTAATTPDQVKTCDCQLTQPGNATDDRVFVQ